MRRVISYYEYITQEGDTFDLLALDMYNDERLAHYIIEYNQDKSEGPLRLPNDQDRRLRKSI